MSVDVAEVVISYMKAQNRPYSVQNVFDNLRGEVPKAKVMTCLDSGVESGLLVVKAFGAQKIYCFKQEPSMQGGDDAIGDLKERLASLTDQLSSARSSTQGTLEASAMFVHYRNALAMKSKLVSNLADLHRQILAIEESRPRNSSSAPVSGDAIAAQLSQLQSERDKRKRIAKDIMGQVSEACGMSRSELAGDLGLELDAPRGL